MSFRASIWGKSMMCMYNKLLNKNKQKPNEIKPKAFRTLFRIVE